MTDLYLVAHKVRGEPAFDVAVQMECPICHNDETYGEGCIECDQLGYWWIIPTSGHRAYPWWHSEFYMLEIGWEDKVPPMPSNLPDHYPTRAEPDKPKLNISALISTVPIRRRV